MKKCLTHPLNLIENNFSRTLKLSRINFEFKKELFHYKLLIAIGIQIFFKERPPRAVGERMKI